MFNKLGAISMFILLQVVSGKQLFTGAESRKEIFEIPGSSGWMNEQDQSGTILYYGWFFPEEIATSLNQIYNVTYFFDLVSNVTSVESFIKNISTSAGVEPGSYFTKPLDPATSLYDPYYHVTAMYCGDKDCSAYAEKVQPMAGRPYLMSLIGFYFTARTMGVRVLLTRDQEDIFDETRQFLAVQNNNGGSQSIKTGLLIAEEEYPGIEFVPQALNFTPSTSKAHITVGCAPNISAVVTGWDLLEIVAYETNTTEPVEFKLDHGVLKQYGNLSQIESVAFVFYPYNKIVTAASFEAYWMPNESGSSSLRLAVGNKCSAIVIGVLLMCYSTAGLI